MQAMLPSDKRLLPGNTRKSRLDNALSVTFRKGRSEILDK